MSELHPSPVKRLAQQLDKLSHAIGTTLSWLTLAMVLLVALIVILRSLLGIGSIALQESVVYLHATVLSLCLGFNVLHDKHVRVDVFYNRFTTQQKAWIDALGGVVFLLPFALFLAFVSLEFTLNAWQIRETSADPGGLPLVFVLKTLLPLAGVLLAVQAFSNVAKAVIRITWD
ncbi:TRAP transporter small permease subunit [Teredinibacter turnerae]|uniref:TRAP transporter small permease subunit n=1 Tax=Teredinibacter turnerae TaxID=2426 RepID=UPI000366FDDC|nr:TRAP transporter small permease subunit [Teredinibacter turnerae]